MTDEIIKSQHAKARGTVHDLLIKHEVGHPDSPNSKRMQLLGFLRSKYGYTNEQAVDDLERLLKQFYKTSRIFSKHHARRTTGIEILR